MVAPACPPARLGFAGVVVIIGSLLGGYVLGSMAGAAYRLVCYEIWVPVEGPCPFLIPNLALVGGCLGATSGLLVSLLWCGLMRAKCRRGQDRLPRDGALHGLCAGVTSTAIVHGGLLLALARDPTRPYKPLFPLMIVGIGLGCGIVLGLLLGVFGGWLCTQAMPLDRPAEHANGPSELETPQQDSVP